VNDVPTSGLRLDARRVFSTAILTHILTFLMTHSPISARMGQPAHPKLHQPIETTLALLPDKTLTPEDEELARKKARLAELEAQLADRELELASFLADLVHFEKRWLQTGGRGYAMRDELTAKIAEA
jgi:hypothetical protein